MCVPWSDIVILLPDCKGLIKLPLRSPICPGNDKTANKSCFNVKALSICAFVYVKLVILLLSFLSVKFSNIFFISLFRENNYKNTKKIKPVSIAFPPVVTADTCIDVEDWIL